MMGWLVGDDRRIDYYIVTVKVIMRNLTIETDGDRKGEPENKGGERSGSGFR